MIDPNILEFALLEDKFGAEREKAKDAYWATLEMTLGDYKGVVNDLPITFDTYQVGTDWTVARNPTSLAMDAYCALGLAGECGELVDEIKKRYRDDPNQECEIESSRKEKIIEEAGDLLYYLAALLDQYSISFEYVARRSQEKSVHRFKERFMNK